MGSGDWFKTIIGLKKTKSQRSKISKETLSPEKSNALKEDTAIQNETNNIPNGSSKGKHVVVNIPAENVAAIRIQTAFRAYMARKTARHLKGILRLQNMIQRHSVKKQGSMTLSYLHSWSRIQSEIRARRICMVTEGRLKQKKLETQLKLEAKLHGLEVDWNAGSETMEETVARIHHREEAAVKRERAMAYAFSHQWRANSTLGPNYNPELGKTNWGWSWIERWIAARPWESRVVLEPCPNRTHNRKSSKPGKSLHSPSAKTSSSIKSKSFSPNGKARKLSFSSAAAEETTKIKTEKSEL